MPGVDIKKENLIKVTSYRVKYKDIFNMKKFYEDLHEWLIEYGWTDLQDKDDHYETLYLEKIDLKGLKEIWIRWRPQKVPHNNPYYRYWLDFDFHIVGLISHEIVAEGKKFKANKGEVELFITAFIELDYQQKWAKHPALKFFAHTFPQRIFRRELYEEHKRELYREAYELQNYIKQWFKLKRHLPYEEILAFHPGEAWPSHLK